MFSWPLMATTSIFWISQTSIFNMGRLCWDRWFLQKWPIGVYRTTNPWLEIVNPKGSYKSMHFAAWTGWLAIEPRKKKKTGWLGYIGDDKLPSYIGIIRNHELKIPQWTNQDSMESVRDPGFSTRGSIVHQGATYLMNSFGGGWSCECPLRSIS